MCQELRSLHRFPLETLLICPLFFLPHLLKVGQKPHHHSLPIRPQQVGWLLLHVSWRDSERFFFMCVLAYIDDYKGKHYSTPFDYRVQQRTSFSGWFSTDNTLDLTISLESDRVRGTLSLNVHNMELRFKWQPTFQSFSIGIFSLRRDPTKWKI